MNFFSKRRRAPAPTAEHSPPAVREASEPETPPVAAEPAVELPPPPQLPSYGPALAAAIQLIDRLDDLDTALQRLVERAAEATGAARAMLWATDPPDASPTLVAWTAADGWQPDEGRLATFIGVPTPTNALQDALPVATSPPPSAAAITRWEAVLLGEGRVAACAATAE